MVSAYKKKLVLNVVVWLADWVTFNVALLIGYVMGWWPLGSDVLLEEWGIANLSYFISHAFVSISYHHRWSSIASVLRNVTASSVLIVLLTVSILGMAHMNVPGYFRSVTLMAVIFVVTFLERGALRHYIRRKRYKGRNLIRAVIVGGGGDVGEKVIETMNDLWNGYRLLGVFDDDNAGEERGTARLGRVADAYSWIEKHHVDEVYIGMSDISNKETLRKLVRFCGSRLIRVYYIPMSFPLNRKSNITEFGETYVFSQYNEPLHRGSNRILKRLFDIAVSSLFLCTLFPVIYVIVAIISKLTMPGPVFFKQIRTGFDGKDFYCYKFRSMKVNDDSDKVQATKGDPRVTKWGRIMRHTNIDELPQFINVLIGDMSLVGPRPHMLAHTEYYSNLISDYMIRHYVRPGITGWAQTHGERGETQTIEDMARRVEKDIWYIEHWSFWLDIQIMLKTVMDVVVGDKKAY